MTLLVKSGRIEIPAGVALRTFTGIGFRGKAVIFKLTEERTSDVVHNYDGAPQAIGFGFATGLGQSLCWYALTRTSTDVRQYRSSTFCVVASNSFVVTPRTRASFSAWTDDGFVLDVVAAAANTYVDYLVIGGDSVTGARAFAFNDPTVTGAFSVTGIGFEPDFVVFGDSWNNTTVELDLGPTNSSVRPQMSLLTAANSVSMVQALSPLNTNANTLMTSLRTDNRALVYGQVTSTTPLSLATLASMDASGGFTMNYSVASGASTRRCGIALAGTFEVACGTVTEPGSPGQVDVPLAWTPKGGLIMSQGRADTTTMDGGTAADIEIDMSWGLWCIDGGHYTSAWSAFRSASAAEMISGKNQDSTFEVLDQTLPGGAITRSRMSLDGSVYGRANFNFDTVSGAGIAVSYLLFGDAPPASQATRSTRRRLAPA